MNYSLVDGAIVNFNMIAFIYFYDFCNNSPLFLILRQCNISYINRILSALELWIIQTIQSNQL